MKKPDLKKLFLSRSPIAAFSIFASITALMFSVAFYSLAAWNPPTATPPGSNAPAPINVSGASQNITSPAKTISVDSGAGILDINAGLFIDAGLPVALTMGTGGDGGRIFTDYLDAGPALIFYDLDDRGSIRFRESPSTNDEFNPEYEATIAGRRGNIGINTLNPSESLQVAGNIQANTAFIGTGGHGGSYMHVSHPNYKGAGQYALLQHGTAGHTYLNSVGTGNIYLRNDNASRMTILSDGRVGIGTVSPSYKLQVAGSTRIDSYLGVGVNPSSNYRIYATGRPYGIRAHGSTMGGRFEDSGGTSRTYVAYGSYGIYQNRGSRNYFGGNVGIGTASPGAKLDVQHGGSDVFEFHSTGAGTRRLGTFRGPANDGEYEYIEFKSGSSRAGIILWDGSWSGCSANKFCIHGDTHQLALGSNASGDSNIPGDEIAFLVSGNTRFHMAYGGGGSRLHGSEWNDWYELDGTNEWHQFYSGGDEKLRIANNGLYADAYFYTSDRSLKKNIKSLENSLDKILQLEGVSYNWKETGKLDVGLIAQDVQKVFPELVSVSIQEETGEELLNLDYGHLAGPIIEAIKELHQENQELREKYEDLEKRIETLEAQ
ncbi:MAG: tail fiber domain-containing protein [Candidatus Spechtbacterales bacterium]